MRFSSTGPVIIKASRPFSYDLATIDIVDAEKRNGTIHANVRVSLPTTDVKEEKITEFQKTTFAVSFKSSPPSVLDYIMRIPWNLIQIVSYSHEFPFIWRYDRQKACLSFPLLQCASFVSYGGKFSTL